LRLYLLILFSRSDTSAYILYKEKRFLKSILLWRYGMASEKKIVCPECNGEKKIAGSCVCDMEWRGSQKGDEWVDCQCTEDEICPFCQGTGYVSEN